MKYNPLRHISALLLLCVLLFPVVSFAQHEMDTLGSKISSEDAKAVLDHHNKIRKDLGVPPLSWNPELAAFAQSWADSLANYNNCKLKHSGRNGYGENIFQGSSADAYKPVDASIAWYSEKQKYKYSKMGGDNWFETAHYTQMIWKTTEEIGVGVATCPSGGVIIVANYYPPGNYSGEYPY